MTFFPYVPAIELNFWRLYIIGALVEELFGHYKDLLVNIHDFLSKFYRIFADHSINLKSKMPENLISVQGLLHQPSKCFKSRQPFRYILRFIKFYQSNLPNKSENMQQLHQSIHWLLCWNWETNLFVRLPVTFALKKIIRSVQDQISEIVGHGTNKWQIKKVYLPFLLTVSLWFSHCLGIFAKFYL